ncbi:hypothetical protein K1T71_012473 [Dendrolimus kikuchii]|uniref:Uncharacterized protein n=1 Tax=Dendrolimus kikuchii TaxID=765133 RepID=A0ACC1CJD8_9NEOP|nr:hypothetical protein K1T71_012473 [Dendrolimus kikuchii]
MSVGFSVINIIMIGVAIDFASLCPMDDFRDAKAVYKSGEINDSEAPITMDKIKAKLKESGIFDWQDPTLAECERKELTKLFEAVEIMVTARNRQPSNVQNMFATLRVVERAVKKQLKEGQLSETLAAKFHWDKLSTRITRNSKHLYYLDK